MGVNLSYRIRAGLSTVGLALLSCFGGTAIAAASGTPDTAAPSSNSAQR